MLKCKVFENFSRHFNICTTYLQKWDQVGCFLLLYFQGKIYLLKFIQERFIKCNSEHLFLNLPFFSHSTAYFGHVFLSINILSEHHFNCGLVVDYMRILVSSTRLLFWTFVILDIWDISSCQLSERCCSLCLNLCPYRWLVPLDKRESMLFAHDDHRDAMSGNEG